MDWDPGLGLRPGTGLCLGLEPGSWTGTGVGAWGPGPDLAALGSPSLELEWDSCRECLCLCRECREPTAV